MSFEKGKEKTGGREKGAPNKRTLEIKDYADSKGVSPANFLIDIISGERDEIAGEPVDKFDFKWALDTLMPYLYGKRKPVDSNGDDSSDPISELVNAFRNK
jgi:hypothetical protein